MPKRFPHGLKNMVGHAKKCVERHCELANRTTQQLYKVATPRVDDHQFEEEIGCVGELPKVCSQMVLKMPVFGSMVCEQTCTCCHQMDQSLRQTFWHV